MAKNDIAGTEAGAGLLVGIWHELLIALRERNAAPGDLHRLATSEGRATIGKLADLIVNAAKQILAFVTTVKVDAAGRFAAAEHFVVDTAETAQVKIVHLGDNFKAHFLGKVEENVPGAELTMHRLKRFPLDASILVELGDRAETTLAYLFALIARQGKGEAGMLLTNGHMNNFYVRDAKGELWVVGASWRGFGWDVSACSVEDRGKWHAGDWVVSR
jgi:hypothetical protein